ncbi:MAG: discoidin domain-containing protein [Methylococcales bacterium]|nr:discoidin domain-containing protein [Methylococcales bacterium]
MIFKGITRYAFFGLITLSSAFSFAATVNLTANPGVTATASKSLNEFKPENAIDSNPLTGWNSGINPPQWIEINLGSRKEISEIKAVVDQSPAGNTIHNVYFDNVLSHTWDQVTEKSSPLTLTLPSPIKAQKIRIETTTSPSWVAWYEVSVFGSDTTTPPSAEYQNNATTLTQSRELSIPVIEYQRVGQQPLFYSATLIPHGKNAAGDLLWKLKSYAPVASVPLNTVSAHLSDNPSTFFMKFDSVKQGQNNYWAQFAFEGNTGGDLVWKLLDFGSN